MALFEGRKSGAPALRHWVVPLVLWPLLLHPALPRDLSERGSERLREQQPGAPRVQKLELLGVLKAEL